MGDRRVSWWDRFLIGVAPSWGLRRVRARAAAQLALRHYEAAQGTRRTSGWQRSSSDANAANGPALGVLRELSRDLRRNNGWAQNGIRVIVNNTVGWGILPNPGHRSRARVQAALELWSAWAGSTSCDFDGRLSFYGLQRLAMETIAESGEVLVVRQPAATADGLPVPLRLQVLEPDYLDTSRSGFVGPSGGPVVQGIEFDPQGRRVAYHLFASHPGSSQIPVRLGSQRVLADRVLHVYRVDRPGQVRGVPWLASAITRLKDFDDFEDAELMQQKVAACFGAFVTDVNGDAPPIGEEEEDEDGQPIEQIQPGHIEYLPPGRTVTFSTPPRVQDGSFTARALRRIAASLGVTYEDLTGDYSNVNFSSARMARLAHWANVSEWREHMLLPQLCDGVWRWVMQHAAQVNGWPTVPSVEWAAPPAPILEPDKEGLAYQRLVRNGVMTLPQVIRERGGDPIAQLEEAQRFNDELDKRGIVLDCDPRRTNGSGGAQGAQLAPGDAQDPPGDGGGEGSDAADSDTEHDPSDSAVNESGTEAGDDSDEET
ncbi:MAG TPA: phage portal protein [Kofleriaceae bacterium]|nr:phage portal protein [Kofleriaceae bacterium]